MITVNSLQMAVVQVFSAVVTTFIYIHLVPSYADKWTDWIPLSQTTVWETSQTFHRILIGMTDIDFGGNTSKGGNVSIHLKRLRTVSSKVAGIMGVIGTIYSIALEFTDTPAEQESQELKYMKSQFSILSRQIDNVSRSVDDVKNLIKIQAQQSAYLHDEKKIVVGYLNLQQCIEAIEKVSCKGQNDCRRKKLNAAKPFIPLMNVRENVKNIVTGAILDRAFGNSFLSLLQEGTKCNTQKIKRYANRIAALTIKGLEVAILHGLLSIKGYEYIDDALLTSTYLADLHNKRQKIEETCYSNVDYWILNDMKDFKRFLSPNIKATNARLVGTLSSKYPWIKWQVITTKSEYSPKVGPQYSFYSKLVSSFKEKEIHAIAFPGTEGKVRDKDFKIKKWRHLLHDLFSHHHNLISLDFGSNSEEIKNAIESSLQRIQEGINMTPVLKEEVLSFGIIPGADFLLGYYSYNDSGNGTVHATLQQHQLSKELHNVNLMFLRHTYINESRNWENERLGDYAYFFTFKTQSMTCSKFCGNGDCDFLPHSTEMECICKKGFSGERCEISDQHIHNHATMRSVFSNTMKLPSLLSIQNTLEDTKMSLAISFTNLENLITRVEGKINDRINDIEYVMNNKFDWFSVVLRYRSSIKKLKYLLRISNLTMTLANSEETYSTEYAFANENKEKVNYILSPTGIQKLLYHINFLISGRSEDVLNSHQPIVFMVMDRLKDRICHADYKAEIDQVRQQLNLLQLQGFLMWIQALHRVGRDSSAVGMQQKMVQDASIEV